MTTFNTQRWRLTLLTVVALGMLAVTAACDQQSETTSPPPRIEDIDAQQLYMRKCAHCHGSRGQGDGPGARSYASVANLREDELQSRLTDDEISSAIVSGVRRMPPVRGLHSVEVDALVSYVRTLADGD